MRLSPSLAALLLLGSAAAACATAGTVPPPAAAPATAPAATPEPAVVPAPEPVKIPEPKVALVLGGGAARGFAHIGVIRVLEQERVPIDMVVGTSVGSLIGAVYASERDSFDLEWTAFQLTQDDIFDFRLLNTVIGMGYAKGEKLEAWVTEKVKAKNIEQLKLPFYAVATDLNWGHKVVMDKGSVAKAVHASSAIPGVFEPVSHYGKILVDGGVVNNLAGDVAREKGADLVIAVDISEEVGNPNIRNVMDVLLQTTNIMCAESMKHLRGNADVLIAPKVGGVGMLDFSKKKQTMQAGIEAARAAMPRIRAAIDGWKAKKAATQPRS
jgi:NTE family protein